MSPEWGRHTEQRSTNMKRIFNFALAGCAAAALAISLGAVGPTFAQMKEKEKTVNVGGAPMYPSKNIIQNAVNSKDHTTLVAAVKAAGLVDTLSGTGPFTVFAPTNEAFAKLPAGTVETLLKDPAALKQILLYHVVAGAVPASEVVGASSLTTLQGGTLTVSTAGGVKVNDANVTATDI